MLSAFVHGFILAFGLILPLGPQNAFILSQGASRARWTRILPVVLVASLSDTALILLAVLGVSVIVLTLPWLKTALILAGGCFLGYIGWITWHTNPNLEQDQNGRLAGSLRKQIGYTLAVSLLNPHAILDTIGVIGTSSLAYTGNLKIVFTAACILNSWLWFLLLAAAGHLIGTVQVVRTWLNRVSALVMWATAIYLASGLFIR
jgi:L-lysine exporter family protein LysE/ArgO